MNFCSKCGNPLSKEPSAFCGNCGASLTQAPTVSAAGKRESLDESTSADESKLADVPSKTFSKQRLKTRGGKRDLIIIVSAVIVFISFIGFSQLKNNQEDAAICKTELNQSYAKFFLAWYSPISIQNQPLISFSSDLSDMARRAHNSLLRDALEADSNSIDKKSSKPYQAWAYCSQYFGTSSK
ncbi:MAG: hypothetical protein F2662_02085 [Actinobacteria bacterium]|uniref:Unannotated protein n=1 Tax=freshwater metagenome TaxID=449393 RepID=A0A6J6NES5_9ZZZZ|nr:hypothetical protein [Actinomycetota bacterium]